MTRRKLKKRKVESVSNSIEKLSNFVQSAMEDAQKFDKGNSAAGTRVRKVMQEVKEKAQGIRVLVQDIKKVI